MNTKHPFDLNRDDKHGPIGGIFEVDRFAEVLNDCAYVKKWPEIPLQQAGVVIEITEPKKLRRIISEIVKLSRWELMNFPYEFDMSEEEYQRYFNYRFTVSPLIPDLERERLRLMKNVVIEFDKNLPPEYIVVKPAKLSWTFFRILEEVRKIHQEKIQRVEITLNGQLGKQYTPPSSGWVGEKFPGFWINILGELHKIGYQGLSISGNLVHYQYFFGPAAITDQDKDLFLELVDYTGLPSPTAFTCSLREDQTHQRYWGYYKEEGKSRWETSKSKVMYGPKYYRNEYCNADNHILGFRIRDNKLPFGEWCEKFGPQNLAQFILNTYPEMCSLSYFRNSEYTAKVWELLGILDGKKERDYRNDLVSEIPWMFRYEVSPDSYDLSGMRGDYYPADLNERIFVLYQKGISYGRIKYYKKSIEYFSKALGDEFYQEGFENSRIYFARALAFNELHQYDEALADCEKAMEIESNYEAAITLRKDLNVKSNR